MRSRLPCGSGQKRQGAAGYSRPDLDRRTRRLRQQAARVPPDHRKGRPGSRTGAAVRSPRSIHSDVLERVETEGSNDFYAHLPPEESRSSAAGRRPRTDVSRTTSTSSETERARGLSAKPSAPPSKRSGCSPSRTQGLRELQRSRCSRPRSVEMGRRDRMSCSPSRFSNLRSTGSALVASPECWGPVRLVPVIPGVGRPYYQAETAIQVLDLIEDLGGRFELVVLVEAVGIEPTSENPQPQASTSIVGLLCVSLAPEAVQPTGGPRGQPHCSRPSPEAKFRASPRNMTPVPGPR